jgi:predicted phosphodiesterase
MRIGLLSDVHGNLVALEAVLADMRRRGPFDALVVAGDLVWEGPWPAEVVDRVRQLDAVVLQGNTDAFLARSPDDPPENKEPASFAAHWLWTQDRLGPERLSYLLGLPFSQRYSPSPGQDLLVVHANPTDCEHYIHPRMADADLDLLLGPASACDWQVLAFGHLHVPFSRNWRDRLLVNVASVGLPRDGDQRAAYAILTWDGRDWQLEHPRVLYELPVVVHEMRNCGLPRGKYLADRLIKASYDGR